MPRTYGELLHYNSTAVSGSTEQQERFPVLGKSPGKISAHIRVLTAYDRFYWKYYSCIYTYVYIYIIDIIQKTVPLFRALHKHTHPPGTGSQRMPSVILCTSLLLGCSEPWCRFGPTPRRPSSARVGVKICSRIEAIVRRPSSSAAENGRPTRRTFKWKGRDTGEVSRHNDDRGGASVPATGRRPALCLPCVDTFSPEIGERLPEGAQEEY